MYRESTADGGDSRQNEASRFDAENDHVHESCFSQDHICVKKVLNIKKIKGRADKRKIRDSLDERLKHTDALDATCSHQWCGFQACGHRQQGSHF
jgi:hypothetical protein